MKILMLIFCLLMALTSLASEEKTIEILAQIHEAPIGMKKIMKGEGTPIVMVHGIDPTPLQVEWRGPLSHLMNLGRDVYYFKWDKFTTLKENKKQLVKSLETILNNSPEVNLVGYSAGGAIALMAQDEIEGTSMASRVHLHTIASPIFGYEAPGLAVFGVPFVGSTTIDIGRGIYRKLKHSFINQCFHWVNTNCSLDKHACENKSKFSAQTKSEMPCGLDNTRFFNNEDHGSILLKALQEIQF